MLLSDVDKCDRHAFQPVPECYSNGCTETCKAGGSIACVRYCEEICSIQLVPSLQFGVNHQHEKEWVRGSD